MTLQAMESGANNITIHSIATNISHESGKMSLLCNMLNSILAYITFSELSFGINFLVYVNEFSSPGNEKLGMIDIVGHEFDEDREFYILKLSKKIEKGNIYQVSISFVSELNDELRGFYRSTYKDKDGNEEYVHISFRF